MVEGVGQEGFFWDTYPWVMCDKSSGGNRGSGSEEKSIGGMKLLNSSINSNRIQMKQPEMGYVGGSCGGDKEVMAIANDGDRKRNGGAFEMTNGSERKESGDNNEKGEGDLWSSDHGMHIWTERERRKKMRNMFHDLHALLPHVPPKADKATIVDEAIHCIKNLQQTLQKLQKLKLEKLHGPSTNTIVTSLIQPQKSGVLDTRESFLADWGSSTSHLGIVSHPRSTSPSFPECSPMIFQTWTSSNVTLNVCGADAHISICSSKKPGLLTAICFVLEKHKVEIISAQISADESKSMFMIHAHANARDQFVEAFPFDEVYRQAATEIMLWINSKSSLDFLEGS